MKEMIKQIEVQQRKLEKEKNILHFNIQTDKTNSVTEKIHFKNTLNDYKNKLNKERKEKEEEENRRMQTEGKLKLMNLEKQKFEKKIDE
jgi:hypothetical protein